MFKIPVSLASAPLLVATLISASAVFAAPTDSAHSSNPTGIEQKLAAIEARGGGRLGVSALDSKTGKRIILHGDDRFLLCSTFKLLLAALVLKKSDEGSLDLKNRVKYTSKSLIAYSPITQKHLKEGSMSVGELCAAAVDYSDNTAANLLIEKTGGLKGFNEFVRSMGDPKTRLDRMEPALNSATGSDERDTTTPNCMVDDIKKLITGDVLKPHSRETLRTWMLGNTTGSHRLRAGFPATWKIGDKTGTGENKAINDIGVAWTGDVFKSDPIYVAVYTIGAKVSQSEQEKMIAEVASLVASEFRP